MPNDENINRTIIDDPWKNETKVADRNYYQEEMINNTVHVHDLKYIRLTVLFAVLVIALLAIDFYNTTTQHDRTVINTIKDSVTMLVDYFK